MIDPLLETLKLDLSEYEYQTYMPLLRFDPRASRADHFVFYAPNALVCGYIQAKYGDLLEKTIGAQKGYPIKVQILPQHQQVERIPKAFMPSPSLNPAFTFDSLVVGECNQMAIKIASKVAKEIGAYNPVLFFGGVGLGKTHILNAIGNFASQRVQDVLYVTAEQFLNDYVFRLGNHSMDKFQDKYRSCDYLLIDDVQFFGGKQNVQEEFFHTFNALHSQKKQIVMTSDKPPKFIKGLAERLLSRFEMGMIASIQAPMLETKIAIISKKCQLNQISMDSEVIAFLASHLHDNIRQIEGALLRLHATATLSGQSISLELAQEILEHTQRETSLEINLESILRMVSQTLNLKPSEIRNNYRNKQVALARKMIIYLARTLIKSSTTTLAQFLGMKDHSAVSKGHKMIAMRMQEDKNTKLLIEEMLDKIKTQGHL
ncbi:chromosomal replication initiator protein DnaA [Helicobacter bizzozeronii CIII-1]|uniref:Chromosomal replication initiator protein DnaA n=1 Tax=Helicobacter bizzozeronii (strain CIII-1) TaxID=1002804 RepID=F8KS72_HELBC|nr:chromosomal replication initiator protein DnaA [Helicobacter bizzozeronii]CCB79629.1 chromosomal replication initiator protein DnaA [Helicobacter bizzozeronii CIII-1]